MKNKLFWILGIAIIIGCSFIGLHCYINYRLNNTLEEVSKLRVEIELLRNLTSQIDSAQILTLNQLGLNQERIDILKEEMKKKKLDTLTLQEAVNLLEKFK